MRLAPAKPIEEFDERDWQAQIVGTKTNPGVARMLGFKAYHTLRSKGSEAGYPDWSLFRERHVYLELKTETGPVSPAQRDWIRAITKAGVEVYVARPRHLEQLALVLSARAVFTAPDDDLVPYRLSTDAAREARRVLLASLTKEIGQPCTSHNQGGQHG